MFEASLRKLRSKSANHEALKRQTQRCPHLHDPNCGSTRPRHPTVRTRPPLPPCLAQIVAEFGVWGFLETSAPSQRRTSYKILPNTTCWHHCDVFQLRNQGGFGGLGTIVVALKSGLVWLVRNVWNVWTVLSARLE